jgi:hypothetical protein
MWIDMTERTDEGVAHVNQMKVEEVAGKEKGIEQECSESEQREK